VGLTRAVVPAPTPSRLLGTRRKKLLAYAVGLAVFGALLFYFFDDWERTGGWRSMNALLLGLYSLVGKWGVVGLCWLGSIALAWTAFSRYR